MMSPGRNMVKEIRMIFVEKWGRKMMPGRNMVKVCMVKAKEERW
jgi:hypothetical protein